MKTIKNLTAEELRKSILQLAIQGKLVKQNPDDEPASELVKRIYEEKNKLVAEGKIKKDKNQSYIFKGDDNCYYEQIGKNINKLEDIPFDIPDSWTWIRFPNLVDFYLGKTPERHNSKYWDNGIYPWFSISDMKDKQVVFNTKEKISQKSFEENFSSKISPAGTLIMSFKLTVGRVSILGVDALHNEAIISIFPYLNENDTIKNWLMYTLGLLVDFVEQTGAIKGNTLNKEKLSKMYIPLPPLNEQIRIIGKINDIEPTLKQYEKIEKELSLLEKEFEEKLKKSILQFAIEGKLVKQNPDDEPAHLLLERIKKEKEQLVKEGKIKKEKSDNLLIQDDYKNYYTNIPPNWALTNLSSICKVITCGYASTPKYVKNGIPFISARNVKPYKFIYQNYNYISEELYLKIHSNFQPEKGDILLTRVGAGIGEACIIDNDEKFGLYVSLTLIKLINKQMNEFILHILQSPYGSTLSKENTYGKDSSQGNLNVNNVRNFIIALPPLDEMNRITIKINQIINLIE